MTYNPEAKRRYLQSAKGIATSRALDRKRSDARLEYKREYAARWRDAHPGYMRERYQTNAIARIANNLRSSLQAVLARLARRRQERWHSNSRIGQLLGCTPAEFRVHIERLFLPGMTWANRGEWHIDHIRQCSEFDLTDPTQQAACFHYTNLRPLWDDDNRRRQRKG